MAADNDATDVKAQIKTMTDLMESGSDDLEHYADDLVHSFDRSDWSVSESPADFGCDCLNLKVYVDDATVSWFAFPNVDRHGGGWIPKRGYLIVEGHVDGKEVFVETDDTIPCPDPDTVHEIETRMNK